MALRLAVLASGRGSNLQAILDAIAAGTLDAEVVGVFSDKPGAPALGRVPAPLRWSRQAKDYADRARFDTELAEAVAASRPDWIVCAGYMRILGEAFVQRFRGRLLKKYHSGAAARSQSVKFRCKFPRIHSTKWLRQKISMFGEL